MTDRELMQQALEALNRSDYLGWQLNIPIIKALRERLAQPEQEPVAWMHNLIDDNIITHRPADIDRHPDRWTALYPEQKPRPTCEALARTVMMDQTGYDTAPPQRKPRHVSYVCPQCHWSLDERKPLSGEQLRQIELGLRIYYDNGKYDLSLHDFARAIERAHGIGDNT